jgi:hypothetical protein
MELTTRIQWVTGGALDTLQIYPNQYNQNRTGRFNKKTDRILIRSDAKTVYAIEMEKRFKCPIFTKKTSKPL